VVIVGFDAADEAIKFANSWGVGCGTDGFGRMSRFAPATFAGSAIRSDP
jgi:hypothetical protein